VVTHQLQVERRTAKAYRPKTNALPLDHATNFVWTGQYGHLCHHAQHSELSAFHSTASQALRGEEEQSFEVAFKTGEIPSRSEFHVSPPYVASL